MFKLNFKKIGQKIKNGRANRRLGRRLNLTDQIYISRQLSVLIGSGLTLHESLIALADESHSKKISTFFAEAADGVNRGEALSDFINTNSKKYGWRPIVLALVKVGEVGGSLGGSFENATAELSRSNEIRKKIISALIYPACVAIFALILIIGIVSFIFPKIIPVLQSVSGDLPISTQIVIFLADFLKNYWIFLTLGVVVFITTVLFILKKFSNARIFLEKFLFCAPLFGGLCRAYSISHIFKSIGVLSASGTNLVEAIDVATLTVASHLYKRALENAKEKISQGERLAVALDGHRLFEKTHLNLLVIGERTGSLSAVCSQIAKINIERFESDIETFSKMIEPALMIALGLTVGFIAISIITPIYEITSNVRR